MCLNDCGEFRSNQLLLYSASTAWLWCLNQCIEESAHSGVVSHLRVAGGFKSYNKHRTQSTTWSARRVAVCFNLPRKLIRSNHRTSQHDGDVVYKLTDAVVMHLVLQLHVQRGLWFKLLNYCIRVTLLKFSQFALTVVV